METKEKLRYSTQELKEFEEMILGKLAVAKSEYETYKNTLGKVGDAGTDSTTGVYHSLENGADTAEKESLNQLCARQIKYMKNLENALVRIKNGTYGICKESGKLISKERLKAVPHTTMSIDAKRNQR